MIAGITVGILIIEVVARRFELDLRVMANAVWYLDGSGPPDVHRTSEDAFLHYELNPGGHLNGRSNSGEPFTTRIDALGARFPSHPVQKQAGIFRILCFGQSTMHGASVSDEETIPASLERVLNQDHVGRSGVTRYEVWNFAVSAYNLAQAAHLGRIKQAALGADLILVQMHNRFPRPLLHPLESDRVAIFRRFEGTDADLLDEQFPRPAHVPRWLHQFASRHVAVYRISLGLRARGDDRDLTYSEALSRREAFALVDEATARNVPVVFLAIPADRGAVDPACPAGPDPSSGRIIDLYTPGREPDFYEVHPPARILDEYAHILAERLDRDGLLAPH